MRRELEMMQVLRVPPLGKLVVKVNDERYQNLSEISDEKVRRVILAAVGELIDFAGGYQALVKAGVAPNLSGSVTPSEEPPLEERQAEFLARLEAQRDALKDKPSRKRRLPGLPGIQSPPATSTEIIPESIQPIPKVKPDLTVAEQIDIILQRYITADSGLTDRTIHLVQDQTGGIGIEVDGKMYQQPADIPEAQIQNLIKRAVKEWDAT